MGQMMYRNNLNNSKFRNKLCPCGSGKKCKKCCGKDYAITPEKQTEIKNKIMKAAQEREEMIKRIIEEAKKKEDEK